MWVQVPLWAPRKGLIMNYIFLDIDGVMNNQTDWLNKVKEGRREDSMFCDEAWQLLSDTCKKVNAVVVLSSSWRLGFTYGENGKVVVTNSECYLSNKLLEYFNNYNINLVGITDKTCAPRGKQIIDYVRSNLDSHDKFIVIDDGYFDIKDYISESQFIKTEFETGLLPEHCRRIIKYFKGE